MFQDIVIKCRDCGVEFILSAGEQEFIETQGFESKPVRCKSCRDTHHGIRAKRETPAWKPHGSES